MIDFVYFTLSRLGLQSKLLTLQNYKKKMERPNFQPIFSSKSDFCESSDKKPVSTFVPNQAMKLSELMSRFERGQRLNVHTNFKPESELTNGFIYEESFDEAPPICHDITDVHEYYEAHQVHKREYLAKKKKPKEQAKPAPAPQVKPEGESDQE